MFIYFYGASWTAGKKTNRKKIVVERFGLWLKYRLALCLRRSASAVGCRQARAHKPGRELQRRYRRHLATLNAGGMLRTHAEGPWVTGIGWNRKGFAEFKDSRCTEMGISEAAGVLLQRRVCLRLVAAVPKACSQPWIIWINQHTWISPGVWMYP